jgi:endonuclease/exonuclease/phosphatase family metal-dependent hydrolase
MLFTRIRPWSAVLLLVTLAACADNPTDSPIRTTRQADLADAGARGVSVMTRNLYLGSELDPVLAAPPNQIPFVAAQTWAAIVASNFPDRAQALADEIAASNPDLIGLQEATVYRRQSPSDFVLGNRTNNATAIAYDFVQILLTALAERGLDYRVVAMVTNTDVELPIYTGTGPLPFDDIRFTDQDVILARAGVETSNPMGGNYAAHIPLNLGGVSVRLLRGWTSVDAVVGGNEFRFVNTHLETQSFPPIQEAQAAELISRLNGALGTVLLVGDFNSAANENAPADRKTASYGMLRGAGYDDLWLRGNGNAAGLTCCWPSDVRSIHDFNQRIDLVMINQGTSHFVGGVQVDIVGEDIGDRTASGLFPSDHAGIAAVLRLPAR